MGYTQVKQNCCTHSWFHSWWLFDLLFQTSQKIEVKENKARIPTYRLCCCAGLYARQENRIRWLFLHYALGRNCVRLHAHTWAALIGVQKRPNGGKRPLSIPNNRSHAEQRLPGAILGGVLVRLAIRLNLYISYGVLSSTYYWMSSRNFSISSFAPSMSPSQSSLRISPQKS